MKKKQLFLILTVLLSLLSLDVSAATDCISTTNITLQRGTPQSLSINLDNTATDITGFQFDLTLPTDVTPATSSTGAVTITPTSRISGSYTLRGKLLSGNTYRFVYLSTSGTGITGKSGSVFSINLTASGSAPCGNYTASISNVTLTQKGGSESTPAATNFNVSLGHNLTAVPANAATCTEAGNSAYWHCDACKKYFSNATGTQEITLASTVVPATGHAYGEVVWTWTDVSKAIVSKTCANDPKHQVSETAKITSSVTSVSTCSTPGVRTYTATATLDGTVYTDTKTKEIPIAAHKLVATPAKAATCTEAGNSAYWHCDACKKYFGNAAGTEEIELASTVIPATGHAYGEVVWTWTDVSKAIVSKTCANDPKHQVSETAKITSSVTSASTCSTPGVRTYTATATLDGTDYTDIKTKEIPIAAHKLVATPAKAATCTEAGNSAYWHCEACDKYFGNAAGTEEIELASTVIPATGHTYGAPVWSWTGLNAAKATFACENGDDTKEVTATITNAVTTPATDTQDGVRTYTAKVTFNDVEYTDTKTEVIPATGHTYGAPEWSWTGLTSAVATFKCKDDNDTQAVTASITNEVTKAATCMAEGLRTYTATVEFEGKSYTDTKTETIPATGHTYSENPKWTWTGYTAAVATFSCTEGDNDVKVDGQISAEETVVATCETAGTKKYTATVTYNNKVYTDVVVEELAALGHNYGEPVWSWADDGKTASAKVVCANDKNHVVEAEAVVTSSVNVPATCTTNGSTLYSAKVTLLGHEYTSTKVVEDVIAAGHTLATVTAKPATCTEPGNKAYWYCSVCKKYFSDAECQYETILEAQVIPATGHTLICVDNGDGTHSTTCEQCDYHESEEHVFVEGVCSICGAKESNDTDPDDYADVLYITKKNVCIGNTTILSLNMKNSSIAATGFETEIVLPEGFSIPVEVDRYGDSKLKIELSTDRTNSSRTNNFMTSILPNGNVKILCYSSNGYAFTGNDGEVARITIELDDDVAEGDYTIEMVSNVISNASKTLYLPDAAVTLKAVSYTLGDANGDNYINVGDLTAIASHILGVTPDNFIMGAADANVDNFINVGDLTFIANMILTGAVSHAKSANFTASDISGMSVEVIGNGNEVVVPVNLDYFGDLSGYQFDVVVPEGYSLKSVTPVNTSDFFEVSELENGIYRVLAYSLSNSNVMSANSELAVITLSKRNAFVGGDIMICNGFVADANRTLSVEPVSVSDNSVNAIETIIGSADNYAVYDLTGKCVKTNADVKDLRSLKNGVYIINGVKVIK